MAHLSRWWKRFSGSLSARLSLVFGGTFLLAALVITLLVRTGIEREMVRAEDNHAQNLLNAVRLNVAAEYASYQFHRDSLKQERQTEAAHISELALREVEHCYRQYQEGLLSEAEAQSRAKDIVRQMRYDGDVGYVWIQDARRPIPHLLMHPINPGLENQPGNSPLYYSALSNGSNLLQVCAALCRKTAKDLLSIHGRSRCRTA
jgi:hypothetical protein